MMVKFTVPNGPSAPSSTNTWSPGRTWIVSGHTNVIGVNVGSTDVFVATSDDTGMLHNAM